jgi:hypothetical protein
MRVLTLFAVFSCVVLTASAEPLQPTELESLYLHQLQNWIDTDRNPATIQDQVILPCSKLTMATATLGEKVQFVAHINMKDYDFRASFCMKATVNTVYPQPEFEKKEIIAKLCAEKIRLLHLICQYFKLPTLK